MDRGRAVRTRGAPLQRAVREPVAAAVPEAAPADLDPVAGQQGNDRLGRRPEAALYLSADLQPGEGGRALPEDVPRYRQRIRLRAEGLPAGVGCSGLCREG